MSKRNDKLLLEDILISGNKIFKYTTNLSFEEFCENDMVVDAVIRNFGIIGEASNQLNKQYKESNNHVEWRDFTDFRNKIIHEYFGVSLSIVFDLIKYDLKDLLDIIENLIANYNKDK